MHIRVCALVYLISGGAWMAPSGVHLVLNLIIANQLLFQRIFASFSLLIVYDTQIVFIG